MSRLQKPNIFNKQCQNCQGYGRVCGPIPGRAQGYLESYCYLCKGAGVLPRVPNDIRRVVGAALIGSILAITVGPDMLYYLKHLKDRFIK